jgi:hypothetical protein
MNRTQMLVMNYIYELPFFKKSSRAVARSLLRGWKVSGITSFFTGVPIDFGCGISGLSTGIGTGVKCNSLGKLAIKKGVVNDLEFGPTPTWFDPNTVGQVTLDQLRADGQPGMFGYMGRNALTGPGRNNWDMALLKDFELRPGSARNTRPCSFAGKPSTPLTIRSGARSAPLPSTRVAVV